LLGSVKLGLCLCLGWHGVIFRVKLVKRLLGIVLVLVGVLGDVVYLVRVDRIPGWLLCGGRDEEMGCGILCKGCNGSFAVKRIFPFVMS
jgi:hypothetical protein